MKILQFKLTHFKAIFAKLEIISTIMKSFTRWMKLFVVCLRGSNLQTFIPWWISSFSSKLKTFVRNLEGVSMCHDTKFDKHCLRSQWQTTVFSTIFWNELRIHDNVRLLRFSAVQFRSSRLFASQIKLKLKLSFRKSSEYFINKLKEKRARHSFVTNLPLFFLLRFADNIFVAKIWQIAKVFPQPTTTTASSRFYGSLKHVIFLVRLMQDYYVVHFLLSS